MDSWANIIKKNDKEFEKPKKIDEIINYDNNSEKETELYQSICDNSMIDVDDEYDRLYLDKIFDIRMEFKKSVEDYNLPFLNKTNMTGKFLFEDYIKYNSKNYEKLARKIENENNEILKQIEEENNEVMEETNDNYNNYNYS